MYIRERKYGNFIGVSLISLENTEHKKNSSSLDKKFFCEQIVFLTQVSAILEISKVLKIWLLIFVVTY